LVLALIALAYVESYLSALAGMWLLITVSLLVGMIASLSSRRAHRPGVQRLRRLVTFVAVGALLLLITQSMELVRAAGEQPQIAVIAQAANETAVGRVILPPLPGCSLQFQAHSFFPETVGLLPVRLAVIGALAG
jgi:phosphatidylglycerophosphate synthase